MLKTEVPDLGAPSQVEGVKSQHRRDVPDADIRDVDASEKIKMTRLLKCFCLNLRSQFYVYDLLPFLREHY